MTDKGISAVALGGNGTKGLNRYVVDFACYCPVTWFWKEYKALNVKVYLKLN